MKGSDAIGLGMARDFLRHSEFHIVNEHIVFSYLYIDYISFVQLQEPCRSARVKIRAKSNEENREEDRIGFFSI